ncbi:hypothetical protein M422DRAFT_42327 [Sphaerobolus stellatus SS14]|nr:hypothetical protein M422DRAFT_42327 [Sphaerobolus stellatus SS14]
MDQHPTRKRKGRACDQCRKSKSRCEDDGPGGGDRPCRNYRDVEISFQNRSEREDLQREQRLSNAEGLLGAIICSNDSRATSLISDLSADPLASSIIQRVREGEFGLAGRAARESGPSDAVASSPKEDQPRVSLAVSSPEDNGNGKTDRPLRSRLNDVHNQPSLEWQDCLNLRLALGSSRVSRELSTAQGKESTHSPDTGDAEESMYQKEDTRSKFFVQQENSVSAEDEVESMDTDNPPADKDLGKGPSDAET